MHYQFFFNLLILFWLDPRFFLQIASFPRSRFRPFFELSDLLIGQQHFHFEKLAGHNVTDLNVLSSESINFACIAESHLSLEITVYVSRTTP